VTGRHGDFLGQAGFAMEQRQYEVEKV